MRKLIAAAALALISTSADAQVHNFQFGEHNVRIEIPNNCQSLSCIRLSTNEKPTAKPKKAATTAPVLGAASKMPSRERAKAATAQPAATAAYAAPRRETPAETQVEDRLPSAATSLADRTSVAPALPPAESRPLNDTLGIYDASPAPARTEPQSPVETSARTEAASPVGLWLTQKGEGRVRIEPCGQALCGFVDGRPSEKVLINMKPTQNNRWSGKINDVRSGGTYMANITLKGANSLRVEGCAFGGMFCGGETWTRVQ